MRLHHLRLEVLAHREAVAQQRGAPPVPVHHRLVQQQVGADLGVGQPHPAVHPAAGQVQIALGGEAGRLQARQRAVDQPQRGEPRLGQQHLLLEPAADQLHVRLDGAARQVQHVGDLHPGQLQRGDPAGQRAGAVQQEQADDPRADAALLAPRQPAVRIVQRGLTGPQVVGAAVAERLPHAVLGGRQALRRLTALFGGHAPASPCCAADSSTGRARPARGADRDGARVPTGAGSHPGDAR